MLALLARYHRKARPRRRDLEFGNLPAGRRRAVRILAAMLRLCDGLDRSHHQLVRDLVCAHDDRDLVIRIEAGGDAELEIWGARRKSRLLERVLGRRVTVELDPAPAALPLLHSA
jgi:exopolyphosphatase/guanosine-5'-triphosphate,3'-diphosphate pyrophosphatase